MADLAKIRERLEKAAKGNAQNAKSTNDPDDRNLAQRLEPLYDAVLALLPRPPG